MDINRILVDLEPTSAKQPALVRAMQLAKVTSADIELFSVAYNRGIVGHWFIDDEFLERAKKQFMDRKQKWINGYANDVRKDGIDVSTEVSWASQPTVKTLEKIKQSGANLLVRTTHPHSTVIRFFMSSRDWSLLRRSPVPILFVNSRNTKKYRKIMSAVDLGHNQMERNNLNLAILNASKYFSKHFEAEQYAVHCYETLSDELMKNLGRIGVSAGTPYKDHKTYLQSLRSHHEQLLFQMLTDFKIDGKHQIIRQGKPDVLFPQLIKEFEIDLLVVGTSNRLSFFGGTVEQMLNELDCDVLVVVEG